MINNFNYRKIILACIIVTVGLLLGLFSTSEYVIARGVDYIDAEGSQIQRHQAVIDGYAGNPWQYRVLAPFLVSITLKIFEVLHIPRYVAVSFIFFRVIQDTCLLLLSYLYYRKLGISWLYAILGMVLLAWGMSYSHYDSDLSFNTFFDVIFYLLAGLCILQGRFIWIIPITFFAALNRETSGLIPFLLISFSVFVLPKESLKKTIPIFITALVTFIVIFFGLRFIYGQQGLFVPYGHHPGLDLLQYNLFRAVTWQRLIATLSIIPLIAIIGYRRWPLPLHVFFWVIVPIWVAIHALNAVMAETRLFLVPQAMIFIPAALTSFTHHQSNIESQ